MEGIGFLHIEMSTVHFHRNSMTGCTCTRCKKFIPTLIKGRMTSGGKVLGVAVPDGFDINAPVVKNGLINDFELLDVPTISVEN